MLVDMTARKTTDSGRGQLRDIIAQKSFQEGEFTLSSGKRSNIFFNLKPTMLDPVGSNLLADEVIKETEHYDSEYIGGLVMGAVPVLISVVVKSLHTPRPLKGFWVRKEQKHHGMQQLIDGDPEKGSRVIIVDDVTTTGESIFKAIELTRSMGCKIACVLTIVDRCEGAKEALQEQGYDLISLFDRYDFTDKRPEDLAP